MSNHGAILNGARRGALAAALLGLILLTAKPARAGNVYEVEPNDYADDSGVLTFFPGLDGLYGDLSGSTYNDDYWKFHANAGSQITMVARAINCSNFVDPMDIGIVIYNSVGGYVTGRDSGFDCQDETLVWTPSVSGDYYLMVFEATGNPTIGVTRYRIDIFLAGPTVTPTQTPMPTLSPSPSPSPTPTPLFSEKDLNLFATGLVGNPVTGHIYVSLPSFPGREGNTIAVIDPTKAEVQGYIFVGSEPIEMTITEGGQYLYALMLGGASAVRIDLATLQQVRFTLGNDPVEGPRFGVDAAPLKGSPLSPVISTRSRDAATPFGARIYDNGIPRPNAGPARALAIEPSNSPNTMYAYDNLYSTDEFHRLNVAFDGLATSATAVLFTGAEDMEYANGLVYPTSGGVVNPTAMTFTSRFGFSELVEPDPANNRMFRVSYPSPTKVTLSAHNLSTGAQLGAADFNSVFLSFDLIRWGVNGLAYIDSWQVVRILTVNDPTILPQAANPVPSKPSGLPLLPPLPVLQLTGVDTVPILSNDLVHSSMIDMLYVSVPNSDTLRGGTITEIEPATGNIGGSLNVGDEPGVMALSPDNQRLYVGLNGVGQVRVVDMLTFTAGTTFTLGTNFGGTTFTLATAYAGDIAVDPLTTSTIAVAEYSGGLFARLAIYDDGVLRPDTVDAGSGLTPARIEYNADGTMLYGYDNETGSATLYRFAVGPNGISNPAAFSPSPKFFAAPGADIQFANGVLYSGAGEFAQPATPALIGRYSSPGNGANMDPSTIGVADTLRGFTYSALGSAKQLSMHNQSRYLNVANFTINQMDSPPLDLATCRGDDVAIRLADKILIARINRINAADDWIRYE